MGIPGLVPTRRFEVWDDVGKLRTFYTKADASRFCHGEMYLIERSGLTTAQHYEQLRTLVGESPF